MKRTDLLTKLKLVEPARSTNELIPILTHFWFQDDRVMAFNDQIAISMPLPMPCGFSAAVPGRMLDMLNNLRVREIELSHQDNILSVKSRTKTQFVLPTLGPEGFIFTMPEPQGQESLPVDTKTFLNQIKSCMRSVSFDASLPEKLGVTLVPGKQVIELFATDSTTISQGRVKLSTATTLPRTILSATFCQEMLELAWDSADLQLEVHQDYSLLKVGDTLLFGRLIESDKPLEFTAIIDRLFPKELRDQLVDMPKTKAKKQDGPPPRAKLPPILDRACIIADPKISKPSTTITIQNGKARFFSKSDYGEVVDNTTIEGHPDVTVAFNPRFLRIGVEDFDKLLLTEKCAIMVKGNMIYLVSPTS